MIFLPSDYGEVQLSPLFDHLGIRKKSTNAVVIWTLNQVAEPVFMLSG